MKKMQRSDILDYIDEKPRTAHLATVREDGRPHSAVIWVIRDGDDVVFTTWHTSVKARNLARTGQAALSIDDFSDGSYVAIGGTVEIDSDPALARHWAAHLGGKYMGEDQAAAFGERNGVEGEVTCRLRPTHMSGVRGITD